MIFKDSTSLDCLHSTNAAFLRRFGLLSGKLLACLFLSLCMAFPRILEVSWGSPNFSFFSALSHHSWYFS
jgi:hypothetical protein